MSSPDEFYRLDQYADEQPGTTYAQLGPRSPIKVPIPTGDHNPETEFLHVPGCAVHSGGECNCRIELNIQHGSQQTGISVVDKRRSYDGTAAPFNHIPIGDYLVVRRIPEEEGLIVEADIAKRDSVNCEVIAVSPYAASEYSRAMLAAIKAGDKILVRTYAGTDIKVDGMEYTLIMVFDVLLLLGEKLALGAVSPPK